MAEPQAKILQLRKSVTHDNMWYFNLGLGGFIVNGFTLVLPIEEGKRPAIMVPTYGNKRRLVRAHGIHWQRLIERLGHEVFSVVNKQ